MGKSRSPQPEGKPDGPAEPLACDAGENGTCAEWTSWLRRLEGLRLVAGEETRSRGRRQHAQVLSRHLTPSGTAPGADRDPDPLERSWIARFH